MKLFLLYCQIAMAIEEQLTNVSEQKLQITNFAQCKKQVIDIPETVRTISLHITNVLSWNILEIRIPHKLNVLEVFINNAAGINTVRIQSPYVQTIKEHNNNSAGYSAVTFKKDLKYVLNAQTSPASIIKSLIHIHILMLLIYLVYKKLFNIIASTLKL